MSKTINYLKTTPIALVFLIATSASANYYQQEIDAIDSRIKEYVDYADKRWRTIEQFNNIWVQIGYDLNDLEISLSWNPVNTQSLSDPNAQALKDITEEKVFVEISLAKLHEIKPRVEAKIRESADVVAIYPDLKPMHDKATLIITQELAELEASLTPRKTEVDQNLELWKQWQVDAALNADADRAQKLLDELQIKNFLDQAGQLFQMVWIQFYMDLSMSNKQDAEDHLTGHVWLRSVLPLFFADKLATESFRTSFVSLLNSEEAKETEMAADLAKVKVVHKTSQSSSMSFEEAGEEGGGEGREEEPNDGPSIDKIKQQANEMKPGSYAEGDYERPFNVDGEKGEAHVTTEIDKSVCVYDPDKGTGETTVTIDGKGFVRYEGNLPKETVNNPSGPELQHSIDGDNRERINPLYHETWKEPCDPGDTKSAGDIDRANQKLKDMIDRAREHTHNNQDKHDLDQFKGEVQKYDNFKGIYGDAINGSLGKASGNQTAAVQHISGISKKLKTKPKNQKPLQQGTASGVSKLATIWNAIWSLVGSSNDQALNDLGNFLEGVAGGMMGQTRAGANATLGMLDRMGHKPPNHRTVPRVPMTDDIRQRILGKARELAARNDIRYSHGPRTGPNSYDCSGFVWDMYRQAGLFYGNGGPTSAAGITTDSNFERIGDVRDAQPGDVVVHIGDKDEAESDHAGIVDQFDADNIPLEISAQIKGGMAKLMPGKKGFSNSIGITSADQFDGTWRIYRWKR